MKKILLTGASGFLGKAFLKRYSSEKQMEILGIGRSHTEFKNYIQYDLTNKIEIDFSPDIVIHAAAKISPWGKKKEYYRQNVLVTQNIIDFCERKKVKKLIFISSNSVYFTSENRIQIKEGAKIPKSFLNEYARSKFQAEEIIRKSQQKSLIIRPCAIIGREEKLILPQIIKAAQNKSLRFFKNKKNVITDVIFIDNVLDCIYQSIMNNLEGEINISNNEPLYIQDFLTEILTRFGLPVPTKTINVKLAMRIAFFIEIVYKVLQIKNEPPITRFGIRVFTTSNTLNVNKMIEIFGQPKLTMKDGIIDLIQWYQNSYIKKKV